MEDKGARKPNTPSAVKLISCNSLVPDELKPQVRERLFSFLEEEEPAVS